MARVEIFPVEGLPEILPGDDLAAALATSIRAAGAVLHDGDVLVVAQKVVSKAEGSRLRLDSITPSEKARQWAQAWDKDPRLVELVLRESRRVVRMERGVIISETHHGYICANAGVDLSNTGAQEADSGEVAILLPEDSDRSAALLRTALESTFSTGASRPALGVIVADSFGRPWRVGLTQVALGVSGLVPLEDYRETEDTEGRTLHATVIAIADEIACAADLVCGKTQGIPAAVVRGYQPRQQQVVASKNHVDTPIDRGAHSAKALIREAEMDLFR